jgi:putative DNA methylase
MSNSIVPLSLRDAPALIERLLPVQKLSAEAYKEQMAVHGKTLTALGSYWKGRKPLILNKACILGCLMPATEDSARDLAIFEKLLGMDDESFVARWPKRPKPKDVLGSVSITSISDYFDVEPPGVLPRSAPVDWSQPGLDRVTVTWRTDVNELERRRLEAQLLPRVPYRHRVDEARRAEEVTPAVHDHIWDAVNAHLGTDAHSFPELVEQLGVMRFGHRPRVADTFCGSGQIPFEAARLGCDVFASDLSPIACMLTWGAFNIVGGSAEARADLAEKQAALVAHVQEEIDRLGVETDGAGWRGKVYLYCVEARCPQTGWLVPLLPTRIISKGYRVIAELIPDPVARRYDVAVLAGVSDTELEAAAAGTVRSDGRGQDPYLIHEVGGVEYRTKISTLRGDHRAADGSNANRLRRWEVSDFIPRPDDIFQERLYCIQWTRSKTVGKGEEYEFRAVTPADLERERHVERFVADHLADWQREGWVPDMRIEPGVETERLYRERGWTHWHHLFNPRQLLVAGLVNRFADAYQKLGLTQVLNMSCRLSRVDNSPKGAGATKGVFDNQALNTLFNYGCRGSRYSLSSVEGSYKHFPLGGIGTTIENLSAHEFDARADIFVTDPPYGDAVKYEEILEFFIAWLRKNPPPEFANWTWDSRRALAIQGEDEDFRRGMVAAYRRMTECMPDNGLQVIMFTHQSGTIWADMANIVWAAGLHVTAAWYVVTETDSALREGSYVKGTVLLVLRKRQGVHKTTRDELAWEIQEEVERQVHDLTGLNQSARPLYRDENVFEDADIQMAGYAAALRVLTRYATIDRRDMTAEALRPRVKGETTFVDGLIAFAVDSANRCLVPQGIEKRYWDKLSGADRFYLKMIDMEARGARTLDNYQNFAKAFKVRDFRPFMASQKANEARLRSATEFGRSEMSEGSEFNQSVLRAVLYAVMELGANVDGAEVLAHLTLNVPNYFGDLTQRDLILELSAYLAAKLENLRADEAAAARILRELVRGQRIG